MAQCRQFHSCLNVNRLRYILGLMMVMTPTALSQGMDRVQKQNLNRKPNPNLNTYTTSRIIKDDSSGGKGKLSESWIEVKPAADLAEEEYQPALRQHFNESKRAEVTAMPGVTDSVIIRARYSTMTRERASDMATNIDSTMATTKNSEKSGTTNSTTSRTTDSAGTTNRATATTTTTTTTTSTATTSTTATTTTSTSTNTTATTTTTGHNPHYWSSNPHKQGAKSRKKRQDNLSSNKLKELVDHYYSCLKKRHNEERSMYETHVVKPGQRLLLRCFQCFKPGIRNDTKESFKWKHLQEEGTIVSGIQSGGNYRITSNRDLVIEAMNSEEDGFFYCINGKNYEAVHQVTTAIKDSYRTVKVNSSWQLLSAKRLAKYNLKVFSVWSHWSKCSQCGKEGFRRSIGHCSVMKLNSVAPVKPVDVQIFYYKEGSIACQSTALPRQIRSLPEIKTRPNEVYYNRCMVACPTSQESTIIEDQSGKVIELVLPGYSSFHKKPKLLPRVRRDVLYVTEGENIKIKCRTDEKIVRWQNGTTPLRHFIESRRTHGRVFIDVTNTLQIRHIQLTDSSIYSCWKQNLLLETTKLVVTKSEINVEDSYIIYSLTAITIFGLVTTSCCIYSGSYTTMAR